MPKVKMTSISRDVLDEICFRENMSYTKIAEVAGINKDHLWRCINSGTISVRTLDDIGRNLDYSPDYLSGMYKPPIDPKNDPISQQLYRDLISYNSNLNREAHINEEIYIQGLILSAGLDANFYSTLSDRERTELKNRLINTIRDFDFDVSVISD